MTALWRLPANFIPSVTTLTHKGPRPVHNIHLYFIATPNRLIQSLSNAFIQVQGARLFAHRIKLINTLAEAPGDIRRLQRVP